MTLIKVLLDVDLVILYLYLCLEGGKPTEVGSSLGRSHLNHSQAPITQ
jgi:hypothetical protein